MRHFIFGIYIHSVGIINNRYKSVLFFKYTYIQYVSKGVYIVDYAVIAKNLSKSYSGREILKNCSIKVEKGIIYGLLGHNGAGKTTLFKLLLGLTRPTAGEASVLGFDIISDRKEILKHTGSLIETPVFFENLSAYENLSIHLSYMGLEDKNIDIILEVCGLFKTRTQPVSSFSLGMRQRLAIARAIVHKPQLLILDEPVNGLDSQGIYEMRELFSLLTKRYGMTILLSSHILSEIEHTADKIGILNDGKIIKEESLENILKIYPGGVEEFYMSILKGGYLYE